MSSNHNRIDLGQSAFGGLDRMSAYLSYHVRRQKVIAGNLANIDTPGYRARELNFDERLEQRVHSEGSSTESLIRETQDVSDDEAPDQDGNTVSLETQLAKSASNTTHFEALSELLTRRVGLLRYAATDGNS